MSEPSAKKARLIQEKDDSRDTDTDSDSSDSEYCPAGLAAKPPLESSPAAAEEEELSADTVVESLHRWRIEDRPTMSKLLKNDIALYQWPHPRSMQKRQIHGSLLAGEYDVLFVHGVGEGTDQGWEDEGRPLSRTVAPGATLSMVAQTLPAGDWRFQHGEEEWNDVVLGHVHGAKKSFVDGFDSNWQYTIQMDDVKVRQHVAEPDCCYVDDAEGETRAQEEQCTLSVLANSGSMDWIPREYPQEDRDEGYLNFWKWRGEDEYWKAEHSWLCNHKGLPVEAAKMVHSFRRLPMPPAQFQWKEGDLLIEMELCDYATSWSTTYLARPKSEELSQRLILAARETGDRTSNEDSD